MHSIPGDSVLVVSAKEVRGCTTFAQTIEVLTSVDVLSLSWNGVIGNALFGPLEDDISRVIVEEVPEGVDLPDLLLGKGVPKCDSLRLP